MDDNPHDPRITKGELSEAFYAMVGRAISDVEYRSRLLSDDRATREAAALGAGLVWDDDLDAKLSAARTALDNLAANFGNSSAAT